MLPRWTHFGAKCIYSLSTSNDAVSMFDDRRALSEKKNCAQHPFVIV